MRKKMPLKQSRDMNAYISDTEIRRNELGQEWRLKAGPAYFAGTVEANDAGIVLVMNGRGCVDGREAARRIAHYNEHIVRAFCTDGHVDSIRADAAKAGKCDRVDIESPESPEVTRKKCARHIELTRRP